MHGANEARRRRRSKKVILIVVYKLSLALAISVFTQMRLCESFYFYFSLLSSSFLLAAHFYDASGLVVKMCAGAAIGFASVRFSSLIHYELFTLIVYHAHNQYRLQNNELGRCMNWCDSTE